MVGASMEHRPSGTAITALAVALAGAVAMGGCGGGAAGDDAGPPVDAGADAAVDGGLLVCNPVAVMSGPGRLDGTLNGATNDLSVGSDTCATVDAPFGVEAQGPDQVIAVHSLEPGVDYAVRLVSAADLAFYVADGCTATALSEQVDECLLFVDASKGAVESGRFTAPASGDVVIVVDQYQAQSPADGSFQLEVYAATCSTDNDCPAQQPACVDNRCSGCGTSFDCPTADKPVCDQINNTCVTGYNQCVGDDPGESGDDGPAGARNVTPAGAQPTVTSGSICNAPLGELDYYRFDVATDGESYEIDLDWNLSSVDLDLEVYDATGKPYGLSLWERPEQVVLTYLPAGTYYAEVNYYGQTQVTTSVDYTITATRVTGSSCASTADCAAEYRNQFFRGECSGGACRNIDGAGALRVGQSCDESPDCASANCAAFPFTADADTRSLCTTSCVDDDDCTLKLGAGWLCTTYLTDNVCVKPCTTSQQCPVVLNAQPQSLGPWYRLHCVLSTGKCSF